MGTLPVFLMALLLVAVVIELLRRMHIREKFAVLWLVIGQATLVLAGFPQLLEFASEVVGVQVPANLLFTLAILLLLGVCLHLSLALTKVEDQTRILAEEVSILKFQVAGQIRSQEGSQEMTPPGSKVLNGNNRSGEGEPLD